MNDWSEVRRRIAAMDEPLTVEQLRDGNGMLNEEDAAQFWKRAISKSVLVMLTCMRCGTTRLGLLHFCWARRLWQRVTGKRRGTVPMYPDPRR